MHGRRQELREPRAEGRSSSTESGWLPTNYLRARQFPLNNCKSPAQKSLHTHTHTLCKHTHTNIHVLLWLSDGGRYILRTRNFRNWATNDAVTTTTTTQRLCDVGAVVHTERRGTLERVTGTRVRMQLFGSSVRRWLGAVRMIDECYIYGCVYAVHTPHTQTHSTPHPSDGVHISVYACFGYAECCFVRAYGADFTSTCVTLRRLCLWSQVFSPQQNIEARAFFAWLKEMRGWFLLRSLRSKELRVKRGAFAENRFRKVARPCGNFLCVCVCVTH